MIVIRSNPSGVHYRNWPGEQPLVGSREWWQQQPKIVYFRHWRLDTWHRCYHATRSMLHPMPGCPARVERKVVEIATSILRTDKRCKVCFS